MSHSLRIIAVVTLVLLFSGWASAQDTVLCSTPLANYHASVALESGIFAATPRWWDETVQWVRNLGWDRGRLVQIWLFFMLVGLYIILRIKPRG